MSLTWRYLIHPDGTFSRFSNINGSLDSVTDEQLARLHTDRETPEPRRCSRCSTELLLSWHGPFTLANPGLASLLLELCPLCDADRPAARAFIHWYRTPDRDPRALPKLFEDWETETMYHLGWVRAAQD